MSFRSCLKSNSDQVQDREEARTRMIRAMDDYIISGVETTMPFCKFALEHEAFVSGNFDTHFVSKHFSPEMLDKENNDKEEVAALFVAKMYEEGSRKQVEVLDNKVKSNWKKNRM